MKVLFFSSSLGAGGAERVISVLASELALAGHSVTVVTLASVESDAYGLPYGVCRIGLDQIAFSKGVFESIANNLARMKRLRKVLKTKRPDAAVAFLLHPSILLALAAIGIRIPVVVSDRCDPRFDKGGLIWRLLRRCIFPFVGRVVVQTESVANWYRRWWLPRPSIEVIPNPLSKSVSGKAVLEASGGGRLVVVGRLVPQKGFDRAIRITAQLRSRGYDLRLTIVGEGPARAELEALAARLGIGKSVHFEGRVGDPRDILVSATVFLLTSRFEGFPNVLIEAMQCGLACVAMDCPSGPREIIHDGLDGILVGSGDESGMTAAVASLMDNPALRRRIGEAASRSITAFDATKIAARWVSLLEDLAQ